MHNHTECEHELKYCRICDVVYCEKCGKEWKKETVYIYGTYTDTCTASQLLLDTTITIT